MQIYQKVPTTYSLEDLLNIFMYKITGEADLFYIYAYVYVFFSNFPFLTSMKLPPKKCRVIEKLRISLGKLTDELTVLLIRYITV